MAETSEQIVMAKVRTLLALERNYLAEERTVLAEFRTGLTLALIGPSASAVVTYLLLPIPMERSLLLDFFIFTFFFIVTVIGIRISFRSRSELKKIRKKKKLLKAREAAIIKSSKAVHNLLSDFISVDDN